MPYGVELGWNLSARHKMKEHRHYYKTLYACTYLLIKDGLNLFANIKKFITTISHIYKKGFPKEVL